MLDNRKSFLVARISAQVDFLPLNMNHIVIINFILNANNCGPVATGGGLLQRSVQGSGELGDGFHAGKDPERLEETGSDEDLLLCFYRACECLWGKLVPYMYALVCVC